MKNLKFVIAAVLISLSVFGKANTTDPKLSVDYITTFRFKSVQKGFELFIKDDQNNTVYREVVDFNGNYKKRFDLKLLQNGSYSVEMERDTKIEVREFSIQDGKITYLTDESVTFFKPTAQLRNNQLFISQYSFPTTELEVKIYYNQNLVQSDKLSGNQLLGRIYQLSATEKGKYFIVMKTGNRNFYKNLSI